jgi:hypothetical protein
MVRDREEIIQMILKHPRNCITQVCSFVEVAVQLFVFLDLLHAEAKIVQSRKAQGEED